MAFYIVQGGTTLKKMTTAGALTSLTLPSGIELVATKRLRGAVLNNYVVLVNSPTQDLTVDTHNNVRKLVIAPPKLPVTLGVAAGGTLTGTYTVKETYIVKDEFGNLLAESDFGPVSAGASPATQWLTAARTLSTDSISGSRLYRTTTGGTTYFPWMDVDGNSAVTVRDDVSDAGLSLVAAPVDLGMPPKFSNVIEWKERLWGVPQEDFDTLWQSAQNKPYAWPSSRTIVIPPKRNDDRGITGFIRRKDELGVGRADRLFKITGTNENNFSRQSVTEGIGLWATDSVAVIHDVGYFLGAPFGVYTWGSSGIKNITDEKVKAWFATDTYFNRSRFDQAVGFYDQQQHAYILLLSAAGSTSLDRWIQYNIATGTWWGPHKTAEFTPTGGVTIQDANNISQPCIYATDGKLYKPTTTKSDGSATAIDFDVESNWLSGGTPGINKTFLDPEIVTKILAGGTLTITPRVGKTNASAGTAISHDMTKGNQRLRRIGNGEFAQFRFRENTAAQDVVIYGFEVPFFENGRRS